MKLLIDSASLKDIEMLLEEFPCDGVTTNPSIIAKLDKDDSDNPIEKLKKIREIIGSDKELHAQVLSETCEDMIKEARHLVRLFGDNFFVKIPASREGIRAIKVLKKENINITATAIYSINQAYLAAKAGADYLAPYVNRMDNLGKDGIGEVIKIQELLDYHLFDTKILAASFKNSFQVMELASAGIGAATLGRAIFDGLLADPNIEHAIIQFRNDFMKTFGQDKTMLDFE